jgi:hypothetical protein
MINVFQRSLRLLRQRRLPLEAWWRDFNSNNPIRYQDLKKIAATLAEAPGLR